MTKIEVLELVKKIKLTLVSNDYIAQIMRNFDDKESVPKEKLKAISKIVWTEVRANPKIADNNDGAKKKWKELIKEL